MIGFWGTNSFLGNIIGAQLATIIISVIGAPWEIGVLVMAILLFVIAIILQLIGKNAPDKDMNFQPLAEENTQVHTKKAGISFMKALMIPSVITYALAFGCAKLLNYSMLMWLPYYLDEKINVQKSLIGTLANFFDLGAITGSILFGWITDRLGVRTPILFIVLLCALPTFGVILLMTPALWYLFFILNFLVGLFVGGANNLIVGSITVDLGKSSDIDGNQEAMATVSGIIDGTGAFGASIGQLLIGLLAGYNWNYVIIFIALIDVCALALISKLTIRDVKLLRNRKAISKNDNETNSDSGLEALNEP